MTYSLYPLKFDPICKEKPWGGKKLGELLGKEISHLDNCGESWEVSAIPGNISRVSNGFLKGNSLTELIEVYMEDLVGERVFERFGNDFPLLFKFLDTGDKLSIQVHPGDALALERHQGRGKEEIWYVLDTTGDAELVTGFSREVSREEYQKCLRENRLMDILRVEKVKKGDVFHIPPGQVHAIGKGVTLCEIQQSSDITYRIFDWDRLGSDGKTRKLHTGEALEVINLKPFESRVEYSAARNKATELVSCGHFTTRILQFDRTINADYMFVDSFIVYICTEGRAMLNYPGGSELIKSGETVLLPAEIRDIKMVPQEPCTILETYIA